MNKIFCAITMLILPACMFGQIVTKEDVKGKVAEDYQHADYDFQYGKYYAAD